MLSCWWWAPAAPSVTRSGGQRSSWMRSARRSLAPCLTSLSPKSTGDRTSPIAITIAAHADDECRRLRRPTLAAQQREGCDARGGLANLNHMGRASSGSTFRWHEEKNDRHQESIG